MSKACRVCGCRRLVGCEWVLKELQIVILCNHSIFHQLNNMLICRCTCTKSYILAVTRKACIFKKRNDYFCDHNVYNDLISLLSHENDCILFCGESISKT